MNRSIAELIQQALGQVYQPPRTIELEHIDQIRISCQVHSIVSDLLTEIAVRVAARVLNPWITLNTLKSQDLFPSGEFASPSCRVGVFPLAANPLHWGHIITSLFAIIEFHLDLMVLLPAGEIDYKQVKHSERAGESQRHALVRCALDAFEPLLRYTDVARGTALPGEAAVHDLRQLNQGRPLDFILVWGVESEQRVRRIVRQAAESLLNQQDLATGGPHSISLAFLKGREPLNEATLTDARLSSIRSDVGLNVPCQLAQVGLPTLSMSSTKYRETKNPSLVPISVHQYATENGLYEIRLSQL